MVPAVRRQQQQCRSSLAGATRTLGSPRTPTAPVAVAGVGYHGGGQQHGVVRLGRGGGLVVGERELHNAASADKEPEEVCQASRAYKVPVGTF